MSSYRASIDNSTDGTEYRFIKKKRRAILDKIDTLVGLRLTASTTTIKIAQQSIIVTDVETTRKILKLLPNSEISNISTHQFNGDDSQIILLTEDTLLTDICEVCAMIKSSNRFIDIYFSKSNTFAIDTDVLMFKGIKIC